MTTQGKVKPKLRYPYCDSDYNYLTCRRSRKLSIAQISKVAQGWQTVAEIWSPPPPGVESA